MEDNENGLITKIDLGPNYHQEIQLRGDEVPRSLPGYEVCVYASKMSSTGEVASSKIKTSPITINQHWEPPRHHGMMITSNAQYYAYAIAAKSGFVIRILQRETKNRALLKGFVGQVVDLAFAHSGSNKLAVVDQAGNLYYYNLDNANGDVQLIDKCLLFSVWRGSSVQNVEHRLVWCPYIPSSDDDYDQEDSTTVAVVYGEQVDVYDLTVLGNEYRFQQILRDRINKGVVTIPQAHEGAVLDLSVSPDGGVLATAGEDGHVKFWRINLEEQSSEAIRLHDYQPHDGAAVSRIMFCDNHVSQDPDTQFWRFLITAAKNNTEVKMWCTVKWKCLQTIRFAPPKAPISHNEQAEPVMLLALDNSASFMLAADIKRMVLHVLQVFQDASLGDASFSFISEYLLTQPIYSFIISEHTPAPLADYDSEDDEEDDQRATNARRNVMLIKVHCIQSRSVQELLVRFEPPDLFGIPPLEDKDSSSEQQQELPEADRHAPSEDPVLPADITQSLSADYNLMKQPPPLEFSTPHHSSSLPALITPNSFLSASVGGESSPMPLLSPHDISSGASSLTNVTPLHHHVSSVSSEAGSVTDSAISLPAHPLLEAMGKKENEEDSIRIGDPLSVLLPISSSSVSASLSDHTMTPEKLQLVTADQQTLEQDKDASSLVIGHPHHRSSESSDNGQEALVMNTLTKVSSLDEGAAMFPSALPDATVESETESGSQTALQFEATADQEPDSETQAWPQIGQQYPPSAQVREEDGEGSERGVKVDADIVKSSSSQEELTNSPEISQHMVKMVQEKENVEEFPNGGSLVVQLKELEPAAADDDTEELQSEEEMVREEKMVTVKDEVVVAVSEEEMVKKEAGATSALDTQLLLQMISQQQAEISALRNEQLNALQAVQESLTKQADVNQQKLVKMIADRESSEAKRQQRLTQQLTQSISSAINTRMDKTIKSEIRSSVIPALQQLVQSQIAVTVPHSFTSVQAGLHQAIQKMLFDGKLSNTICSSLSVSLQQTIQSSYEAAFKTIVLPSFERALKEMLNRVNEAFRNGTSEYLGQLSQQQSQLQENTFQQLAANLQSLPSVVTAQATPVIQTTLQHELQQLHQQLLVSLNETLSAAVKHELSSLADVSGAKKKEKREYDEAQLLKMLKQQKFNDAFNFALSTADLHLVIFTCQQVSPEDVFDNNPNPLQQPVLLSLIQQLSVKLLEHLELKIKFLEHSILCLDPRNEITSSHIQPVLSSLSHQLTAVEQTIQQRGAGAMEASSSSTTSITKKLKRVRMLADHLCRPSSGH